MLLLSDWLFLLPQGVCGTFASTVSRSRWAARTGTWWGSWRGGAWWRAAPALPAAGVPAAGRCSASTSGGSTSAGRTWTRPPPPPQPDVTSPSPLYPLRCPGGQVTLTDASGQQSCRPSPCTPSSCRNGGVCQPSSAHSFSCSCQDGFRGQRCQLGQVKAPPLALGPGSILAVSMSLLLLLGEN